MTEYQSLSYRVVALESRVVVLGQCVDTLQKLAAKHADDIERIEQALGERPDV